MKEYQNVREVKIYHSLRLLSHYPYIESADPKIDASLDMWTKTLVSMNQSLASGPFIEHKASKALARWAALVGSLQA